jgi:hypothetical protein
MTGADAFGTDGLLRALQHMWASHDPAPDDLDDGVLAVLNAQMIVTAASLTLISDERRLVGVRSVQDARTLTFSDGTIDIVLRLVADGEGTRIDGWAVPVALGTVTLRSNSGIRGTNVDENGRFAFTGIRAGTAELWFEPAPGFAGTSSWRAPVFIIPDPEEHS